MTDPSFGSFIVFKLIYSSYSKRPGNVSETRKIEKERNGGREME